MRVAMCALVAVLVLAASTASAGGRKHDWELGGYGGYGWLDEYAPVLPKNDMLFGGRLGYFVSRHWSFEVSGQRILSERDTVGESKVNLDALRGNVLYNLDAEGMVRPFLTIGLGWEKFDPEDLPQYESKQAGFNAGAGVRVFFNEHVGLRVDGRFVHYKADKVGDTAHDYEANAGLSVYFGGHDGEESAEVVTSAPPPVVNSAPTVSCSADHSEVMPGTTATITATASDPDGDPLTFEWVTSAGHVVGTGNTVTLDFNGVTGPAPASVTVRVSDGHGHTATCDASVSLAAAAPPPAEAISCLAGGFPRNAARLTNVDKACLDDVVQRLRNDPRAHVVVIGHSDTRETSRTVAQQRADAVKGYLVAAGVEAGRVTTRSAGSTHPTAMGTDTASLAQNRRCEVWFVPEGAQEPSQP